MNPLLGVVVLVSSWAPLHAPGDQVIWVNPDQVVSVRTPRDDSTLHEGVRCWLDTVNGKPISVEEDCDAVCAKIGKCEQSPKP